MNLIYNSEQYSVVEFQPDDELDVLRFGSYQIMDKPAQREIFIAGKMAASFREIVSSLISLEPSVEEIDDFLASYGMMSQPIILH